MNKVTASTLSELLSVLFSWGVLFYLLFTWHGDSIARWIERQIKAWKGDRK